MKLEDYIKKFERRVKKYPEDWQMQRKIGKRLVYKLKKNIKRNPKNLKVINWCGIIALEINDGDLALKMFKRAMDISPNVQSLTNLAYFYQYEYEDHQKAVELLERVIKMEPSSGLPYGLIGEVYLDLELYKKAEEAFKKAISCKAISSVLNNLGVVVYKQQKIKEAAIYFQMAYKSESSVKDDYLDPLHSYGVSLAQAGEIKGAKEVAEELKVYLKEFLQTEKSMIYLSVGFLEIAEIYYESHNYTKANEMFNDAFDADMRYGMDPDWISQYQYSLVQCGRVEEAEEVQRIAILDKQNLMNNIDEEDYHSEEEYRKDVEYYEKKIEQHIDLFDRVKGGYRPSIDFNPRVLGNCYLYGCVRHGNSEFLFPSEY